VEDSCEILGFTLVKKMLYMMIIQFSFLITLMLEM
jgi:hypothetical protein